MTSGVAIILVTWNQEQDALECLASLGRMRWKDRTVVLVDNGSEDRTVESVRSRYPETVILESGGNPGFAAANNRGIRYALEQEFPFVFLLNTDTVVAEDIVAPLVDAMNRDPWLGIAGPKMYYHHEPDRIWFAGGDTDPDTGHSVHFRIGEKDLDPKNDAIIPCSFITGAGMFIRSEVFRCVGFLDESYFHTAEDNDFCIRTRRAGFGLACVPRARLWHKVMTTTTGGSGKADALYTYYEYRNKLLLIRKHSRGRGWMRQFGRTAYKIAWREWVLLVREKNPGAAAALLIGLLDFARGRSGKRSFSGRHGRSGCAAPQCPR